MGEFLIKRLESYILGLTWKMIIENKIKNDEIKNVIVKIIATTYTYTFR